MLEAERLYDDTLMKPVDVRQLLKKIHALVNIEWIYETEAPSPGVTVAPPPGNSALPAGCDIDELIRLGEIGHVTRILEAIDRDRKRLAGMPGVHCPDARDGERF